MAQYYLIKSNMPPGEVVDLKGSDQTPGTPVIAFPVNGANGTDNQKWELEYSGVPPYFFVKSKLSNHEVLDIKGADQKPGTPVIAYPKNPGPTDNQLWMLVPTDDKASSFYLQSKLTNPAGQHEVLDIQGSNPAPATPLIAFTKNPGGTPNQQWRLVPA